RLSFCDLLLRSCSLLRRPPRSTLCPSTTLFRSAEMAATGERAHENLRVGGVAHHAHAVAQHRAAAERAGWINGDDADFSLRRAPDRKSTRLNSSHVKISYAVFCLKKKKNNARTR